MGEAVRRGLLPVVLTFEPHPASVIRGAPVPRLTTLERRCELLARVHPALALVVEPFTPELALLLPDEFVRRLLVDTLDAREVVVGKNFRFGRERRGDVEVLQRMGAVFGFGARAVILAGDGSGPFSSSRARSALASADLQAFLEVVGRPHSVSGPVVAGRRLGRRLGMPTANLDAVPEALPPRGVYACLVEELPPGGPPRRLGAAAVNVGTRPTVDGEGETIKVEAHVLSFAGDLYGRCLRIHFEVKLRDERRFADLDELRDAMARDLAEVEARLRERARETARPGPWY